MQLALAALALLVPAVAADTALVATNGGRNATAAASLVNPHSGSCIDADTATFPADRTKIQLWKCTGGASQLWTVADGRIENAGSCIEADPDTFPADETKLQLR